MLAPIKISAVQHETYTYPHVLHLDKSIQLPVRKYFPRYRNNGRLTMTSRGALCAFVGAIPDVTLVIRAIRVRVSPPAQNLEPRIKDGENGVGVEFRK